MPDYDYTIKKCPLGHADVCIGEKCAIFVESERHCAIRAITLSVMKLAKPIKKGGK